MLVFVYNLDLVNVDHEDHVVRAPDLDQVDAPADTQTALEVDPETGLSLEGLVAEGERGVVVD